MSADAQALLIWLPAGTLLPFLISRLTGADWRGALVEASFFAVLGLLLYPTLIALLLVRFAGEPPVALLFVAGFVLAALSLLLFRRRANRRRRWR